MSEMEYHVGSIKEFIFPKAITTWADKVAHLRLQGIRFDNVNIEKQWVSSEDVIEYKNRWYLIQGRSICEEDESTLTPNDEGGYDYKVSFYNGGGVFEDILYELIDSLEEKSNV